MIEIEVLKIKSRLFNIRFASDRLDLGVKTLKILKDYDDLVEELIYNKGK